MQLPQNLNFANILAKAKDLFSPSQPLIDSKQEMFTLLNDSHHHLKFASHNLLNDASFAEIVVQQQGDSLGYFDKSIKDNEDVVQKAIANSPLAIFYASDRLKMDKSITLPLIRKNNNVFKNIPLVERENGFEYINALVESGARNVVTMLSNQFIRNNNNLKELLIILEDNHYIKDSGKLSDNFSFLEVQKLCQNVRFKKHLSKFDFNFINLTDNNLVFSDQLTYETLIKIQPSFMLDVIDIFHTDLDNKNQQTNRKSLALSI